MDNTILEKVFDSIINENSILETGLVELDELFYGLEYGSLITLSSLPAMGKTTLIISLLYRLLKQNKKCLFLSNDLGVKNSIIRLLLYISKINVPFCLIKKQPELIEKINLAKAELSKLNLTISDNIFDTETIKSKIETYKPEFVFIENNFLLCVENQSNDSITNTLIKLKSYAIQNNCIIFIVCPFCKETIVELNKSQERPILSNLKHSGLADEIADVVIFLHRQSYFNNTDNNETEIFVAKNKYNSCGSANILLDKI